MNLIFLLGRIIFGGFFVLSGLNHFTNRSMYTEYAASKRVSSPGLSIVISGLLLLLGGLSIVLGLRPQTGLCLILLFLAVVTPKMHNFWSISDTNQRMTEMVNFMKNMALFGAALLILSMWAMIPQPLPFSLGR
jgi:putative oxidoreductase